MGERLIFSCSEIANSFSRSPGWKRPDRIRSRSSAVAVLVNDLGWNASGAARMGSAATKFPSVIVVLLTPGGSAARQADGSAVLRQADRDVLIHPSSGMLG